MICKKMIDLLSGFVRLLFMCRIYIGRRPIDTEAPALIFFPIQACQLNCGFAGLMTCRLPATIPENPADQNIARLWENVKSAGRNICGQYLGGMETVNAMDKAVSELKREDMQEFLFFEDERTYRLSGLAGDMKQFIAKEESWLEGQAAFINSVDQEVINSRLLMLKDLCWMLEKDILANLPRVLALTGAATNSVLTPAAFRKYRKINLLLNALDRLEVRGRDSAGIELSFLINPEVMQDVIRRIRQNGLDQDYQMRTQDGDLLNTSISASTDQGALPGSACITFTYKTFSIVGELGRNVADLRSIIGQDRILQCFADAETEFETALTHTRWASVGSITEENCHPLNNHSLRHAPPFFPAYPGSRAHIHAVLNGDIDNYAALRQSLEKQGELIAERITTDTKIIPLQIEKYLQANHHLSEAFRLAVNDFQGSHAIAMTSHLEPGKMFLALKGSGQSIYVGISSDQYMFSSELYGVVEVMPGFLKMNGEDGGQIFILDAAKGNGVRGITACRYDGTALELTDGLLQTAEMTTRDIDRGSYPHYFLKEISEAALSVKKTLRGKYRISQDGPSPAQVIFNMGPDIIPAAVRTALQTGDIKKITVIGHGTAAVAGQAVADALSHYLEGAPLQIHARVASELSGFGLKDDLADTLIIPITQSGTTTDTNRAVAMARERGAHIISIVNRRQSDITAKSSGVFYTSDGRDIEMSVASTKAFYAQIVAGQVLALFFAQLLGVRTDDEIASCLRRLESAPRLMDRIFAGRDAIARSAQKAADKKFWAVVGSGPNKAAADEIRIKLSELCYKTISSDIIENKKHIDLSAEPLILVCASGNPETVMEDVVKDVEIFKAHQAAVIVIADEHDSRFDAIADAVLSIPAASAPLPVILNTMAGHLWGYYAALAIDAEAQIFRDFRGRLATELTQRTKQKFSIFDMIADDTLHRVIHEFYVQFNAYRRSGAFGVLGGKTLADLMLLMKYAAGKLPLQEIRQDFNSEKDLFSPYDLLDVTLGTAIDELTRPIDAIRHQAKTVTVGTSRKEKELEGVIFDLLKSLKFTLKDLAYREILTIKRIQPAIAAVRGYTIYDIHHLDEKGHPAEGSMIAIRSKGGVAANMKSRADHPTELMGVKRTIVSTGHVYLGRGKTDGVPIMIIPLSKTETGVVNLLLVHIRFNETLNLTEKIAVLGYRYHDIRNLVDEYNLIWNDRYLENFSMESLFSEPIEVIAGQIKSLFTGRENNPT